MNSRRAFTLLELLAVLAVIAVLSTLLIPLAVSMRSRAQESKCLTNLRSLGVAGRLFAQDHQGKFSSSRLYNSGSATEPGLIDYLDNNPKHPAFTCPTLAEYGVVQTYTLALAATDNDWGPTVSRPLRRQINALFPAQTAWMMDGAWVAGSGWFSSAIIPGAADLANLRYPHKGRQNVLFVDGHVETVEAARLAAVNSMIWSGVR